MAWRKNKNEVENLQNTANGLLVAIENARKRVEKSAKEQEGVINEILNREKKNPQKGQA